MDERENNGNTEGESFNDTERDEKVSAIEEKEPKNQVFNKFLSESRINPGIPVKLEPVEYSSKTAKEKPEHVFWDKYSSRHQKVTKES